jgi:hypothetical protein
MNNPFLLPGNWYKGNLHTHTTNSDGKMAPEILAKKYLDAGFHFLALTDHWKITRPNFNLDGKLLILEGLEVDVWQTELNETVHIVGIEPHQSFDIDQKTTPPQQAIDILNDAGALTFVAHPYWSSLIPQDMLDLHDYLGVEVYNHGCEVELAKGFSSIHWDDLLIRGKKLFGFAVDDTHQRIPDYCGGWVWVKAPELTKAAVCSAIREGSFYSSTGPEIYQLEIQDKKAYIECSPVCRINFMGNGWTGWTIWPKDGKTITGAEFPIRDNVRYLRVECVDKFGKIAWSNPFYF